MNAILNSCGIFLLIFHISCGESGNPVETGFDRVDTIAAEAVEKHHIPSLAIGVVKGGEVVYSKTFGLADVEKGVPVTGETVYQLGSVTKTFTGYVLASLVSEGKIRLSDPLALHLPDTVRVPPGPNGEIITVEHLATHTAGFPRYPDNLERIDPEPILGYTKTQLYKGIEGVEPASVPGTEYLYSNFGYGVLGTVMENAAGESLDEMMERYIFGPAGMRFSSLRLNNRNRGHLATPYLEVYPNVATQPWQMGALSGAGNSFSTLEDMSAFIRFALEKNEVNRIQQQGYYPINESWSYGLGCFVIASEKWETTVIFHGGDVDGYASSLTIYPDYELGLVMLTNYGEGSVVGEIFTEVGEVVADLMLGKNEHLK